MLSSLLEDDSVATSKGRASSYEQATRAFRNHFGTTDEHRKVCMSSGSKSVVKEACKKRGYTIFVLIYTIRGGSTSPMKKRYLESNPVDAQHPVS